MHGQFIWYELTTTDVDAAQKFYPRVTGWGTQKFDADYTMWTTGGAPVAGIFKLGPEMSAQGVRPNWMPYVESSDVDQTAKLATSLGGKTLNGPADIPGTGRYAVLQDPQGAVFGVYKSSGAMPAWNGTPTVGRFSWHELMTTDWKSAFEFYRKLFGWELTSSMDMGGGNMYAMYGKGRMYGGMFNRSPEMASMPPFWLCYIHVADVGRAVDMATTAGAFVQRPRMDVPGGTIAILGDPQGAGFALHDVTAAAPATTTKPATPKRTKAAKAPARAKAKSTARKASKAKSAAKKGGTGKPKSKPKPKSKSKSKPKLKSKAATKQRATRATVARKRKPAKKAVKRR